MTARPKTMPYAKATDLLRQPGFLLMQFNSNNVKRGREYYVVPGGRVTDDVAEKILQHPLIHEVDGGLFPGHPQSWSLFYGDLTSDRPASAQSGG
jgi:hypothetical protein